MSKRKPKQQNQRAIEPAPHVSTCVEQAEDMYRRLINAVNVRIGSGDVNSTLIREAASVIRAAATLDGEKRKAEKEAKRHLQGITRPLVTSWARQLDQEERRSIIRELAAMDVEGSILA